MSFLTSSTATKNAPAKEVKATPINTLTSTGIFIRVFEYLLCLLLDPFSVAPTLHVERSQEL